MLSMIHQFIIIFSHQNGARLWFFLASFVLISQNEQIIRKFRVYRLQIYRKNRILDKTNVRVFRVRQVYQKKVTMDSANSSSDACFWNLFCSNTSLEDGINTQVRI